MGELIIPFKRWRSCFSFQFLFCLFSLVFDFFLKKKCLVFFRGRFQGQREMRGDMEISRAGSMMYKSKKKKKKQKR